MLYEVITNRGRFPEDLDRGDYAAQQVARVYALYQERLKRANALDFGDLLLQTVRLFVEHPEVLERYRQRFRHILVDEFQDTNHAQFELVKLLAARSRNIAVVSYNFV